MNESSSKPRFWRFQFSLRSFLVGSTLASLGIWWAASWYRQPGHNEIRLTGGLSVWEERHIEKADERGRVWTIARGRFSITDEHGRVWCRGRLDDEGLAIGRWTWFHASGAPALTGQCAKGNRVGRWTAWNEQGDQTLEVEHGTSRETSSKQPLVIGVGNAGFLVGNPSRWNAKSTIIIPRRSGPATLWHAGGRPSESGSYANDCREGAWTFWNERGQETADGSYRQGLRHGPWTYFDPSGRTPRTVHFINGAEVPDLPEKIAALAKQLDSTDWEARADAIEALGRFGIEALPALTRALAHRDGDVVARALRSLATISPDASGAVDDVRRLADGKNVEALLALFALDEVARRETLGKLLALADLDDDEACRDLHMRIAQLGEPVLAPLAKTLDSDNASQRLAALDVLACMIWPSTTHDWQFPHRPDYRDELLKIFQQAEHNPDPVISAAAKKVLEYLKTWGPNPPWRKPGTPFLTGSIIPVVG